MIPKISRDHSPWPRPWSTSSKRNGSAHNDELCLHSKWAQGKVAWLLLNMEFNGVVRSLPGKVYRLN